MPKTNTPAMSKTRAMREARRCVGGIIRRSRTDYVYFAPYYATKPSGPSTECQADSYPKAVASRSRHVAEIALVLMGYSGQDASEAAYMASIYGGSADAILAEALADLQAKH